jgi:hypothetical protein
MFDPTIEEELLIRGSDLAIGTFFILLPVAYSQKKTVFFVNGDPMTKWIYIYMLLYWIEFFVTVLFGRDSWSNGMKVIRVSFVAWGFFIFKTIPLKEFTHFLKVALFITLVQSIFYFLQFFGITLLANSTIDSDKLSIRYATNIPTLTTVFIFLLWKAEFLKKWRIPLFTLLISMVFLKFVRGAVISVLVGLAYYAFVSSERKRRIPIILMFLILIPIASKVIDIKSEASGGGSGLSDLTYVINNRSDFTKIDKRNGTFSYRMAMLTERVVWLFDHPQYLITGVGTMHEDSPQTIRMFHFQIGTHNEDRALGYTLIESGDITWVPVILRYGLIGLFVHGMLLFVMFNQTRRRKDMFVTLAAYTISVFMGTFDSAFFEKVPRLFPFILFYSIVARSNYERFLCGKFKKINTI